MKDLTEKFQVKERIIFQSDDNAYSFEIEEIIAKNVDRKAAEKIIKEQRLYIKENELDGQQIETVGCYHKQNVSGHKTYYYSINPV